LKSVFIILVLSLSLFMSGCSWIPGVDSFFDDSEYDYTKAKMDKEMQVPEHVGESNVQDKFIVPELDDDNKGEVYGDEKDILAPMQVLTLGNKVRANRESKNASAFVDETEIRLWDIFQRYLEEEEIQILNKDLANASIMTDWQTIEDNSFWSTPEISAWRFRYQITVGDSKKTKSKTITVKTVASEEKLSATGKWQPAVDNKRVETEFLNSILGFMYIEDIETSRQLVDNSGLGGISVSLGTDKEGNSALVTATKFDELWTKLPISLALLNINIEDQDRSKGLFYINNIGEDKGFFTSIAFWRDEDKDELDIPKGTYRIKLVESDDQVTMIFIDGNNQPLSEEVMTKNYPLLAKAFRARTLD